MYHKINLLWDISLHNAVMTAIYLLNDRQSAFSFMGPLAIFCLRTRYLIDVGLGLDWLENWSGEYLKFPVYMGSTQ